MYTHFRPHSTPTSRTPRTPLKSHYITNCYSLHKMVNILKSLKTSTASHDCLCLYPLLASKSNLSLRPLTTFWLRVRYKSEKSQKLRAAREHPRFAVRPRCCFWTHGLRRTALLGRAGSSPHAHPQHRWCSPHNIQQWHSSTATLHSKKCSTRRDRKE